MRYSIFSILFLLLIAVPSWAQAQSRPTPTAERTETTDPTDSTKIYPVLVDFADELVVIQEGDTARQELIGNVELRQDSIFMYCDTATITGRTQVKANGSVIIQKTDTTFAFSDTLVYDGISQVAELFGEVVLVNGRQKLFTNRLTYDLQQNVATYYNGATLTDSTTQLTSRRGYYFVDSSMVYFRDSVVVADPDFTLKADTLAFNTETKLVRFLGPTLMLTDSSRVYCEDGFYNTNDNVGEFRQQAQFERGDQRAIADTIRYDGRTQKYYLLGEARYRQGDERRAVGDRIIYNEAQDITTLEGNARFRDGAQEITGDFIQYNATTKALVTKGRSRISDPPNILLADQVDYEQETGLGIATGNVVWQDTAQQLTVISDRANYRQSDGYLEAVGGANGRPYLISIVDGDSLWMAADTLRSVPVFDTIPPTPDSLSLVTEIPQDSLGQDSLTVLPPEMDSLSVSAVQIDTSRSILAFHDVRLYKSNLQAIADSMAYSSRDSIFRFFQDPIVWSDTSQFVADTILIKMKNESIDQVLLRQKAFIINSPDEKFYNQVKGKYVTVFFEEEEVRRMLVDGNAESIYFAQDDLKAYIGVNQIICSNMLLFFGNNQIERINFYAQPNGSFTPMQDILGAPPLLDGFRWERQYRPMRKADLFDPDKKRTISSATSGRPYPGKSVGSGEAKSKE